MIEEKFVPPADAVVENNTQNSFVPPADAIIEKVAPAPKQKSNVQAPQFVAPTNVAPVNPKTITPSTAPAYDKRKLAQDESEVKGAALKRQQEIEKEYNTKINILQKQSEQPFFSKETLIKGIANVLPAGIGGTATSLLTGLLNVSPKNPQKNIITLQKERDAKIQANNTNYAKQQGYTVTGDKRTKLIEANNNTQLRLNDEILKLQDDRKYYSGLISNEKNIFTAEPDVQYRGGALPLVTYAPVKPEILQDLAINPTGDNNKDFMLVKNALSQRVANIDADITNKNRRVGISKTDVKNLNNGVDYAKTLSPSKTSNLVFTGAQYNPEIGKFEKKAVKQVGDVTSMDIATAEKASEKDFSDYLKDFGSFSVKLINPLLPIASNYLSSALNLQKEGFTKKLSYNNLGAEKSKLTSIDAAVQTSAIIIDNRLDPIYNQVSTQFGIDPSQIKNIALGIMKISDNMQPNQRLQAPKDMDPKLFNDLITSEGFQTIKNTYKDASDIFNVDGKKERLAIVETDKIMQQKAKEFGTVAKFKKDVEREQAYVDVMNKKSKDASILSNDYFNKLAYETAYSLTYGIATTKELAGGVAKVGETVVEDITKKPLSNITKANINELVYSTDLFDALVPTNSALNLGLMNTNKFVPIKDASGKNLSLELNEKGNIKTIHAEDYSYIVRDPKQIEEITNYYEENKDNLKKTAISLSTTPGGKRAIFDNTFRNVGKEVIQEGPTMLFEIASGGALAPLVAGSNRLRKVTQYGIAAASNMLETYPMIYKGYEESTDDPNNPYAAMLTTGGLGMVSLFTSGLDRKLIGLGERAVSKEVLPEIIENASPIIKAISKETAKIADKQVREMTFKSAVNKAMLQETMKAFKPAFRKALSKGREMGVETLGEVTEETVTEPLTQFTTNFLNSAILDNQAYKQQTLDDLGFLDPETAWLTFWTAGAISTGANIAESMQKNNPYTQVDYVKAALQNPDKIDKMLTNIEEDNSPEVIQKIRNDYSALKTSYDAKKKELNISQDLLESLDFSSPAVKIVMNTAGINQDVVDNIRGTKNYDALIIQQVLEEKKARDLNAEIQQGVSQGLIEETESGYKAVGNNPLAQPYEKTIADFQKTTNNIQYFDNFIKDFNAKTAPIQRQFMNDLQKSLVVAPDLYDVMQENQDESSLYYNVNAFNNLRTATLSKLVNQARLAEIETEMIGSKDIEKLQEEKARVSAAIKESTDTINTIQKQYKAGRTEVDGELKSTTQTAALSRIQLDTAIDTLNKSIDVDNLDLDNHEINDIYDKYTKDLEARNKVATKLQKEYSVDVPIVPVMSPEEFSKVKQDITKRRELGKKLQTNQGTLADLRQFVGEVDTTSKIAPETAEDINEILNDEEQVLMYADELKLADTLPYSKVKEEVSVNLHARLRQTAADNAEEKLGINEILTTEIPKTVGQNTTYIIDGEEYTVANRPNSNVVTITENQKAQVVLDELGREIARRMFSETMNLTPETLNAIKVKALGESYPELGLDIDNATIELIGANIFKLKTELEAQGIEVLFNDKIISSKFTAVPESENSIIGIASKIPLIAITPEGEIHLISFKLFTGTTYSNVNTFADEMTTIKALFEDNKVQINGIHTLPINVKMEVKDGVVTVDKTEVNEVRVSNEFNQGLIPLKTNVALENEILDSIEVKPVVEEEEKLDVEVVNEYVQVNRGEYSNGVETKYIVPTSNSDLDPYIEINKEVYDKWKKIDDKEQEEKQTLEKQLERQEERYRNEKEEESISRNVNQYLAAVNQTKANLKANALKYAAEKRQVLDTLTDVEKSKIKERDNKLILGDEGTIDGVQYKVIGFPFGKVKLSATRNGAESVLTVDRESDIAKKLLNIKKSGVANIEKRKGTLIADLNKYLSMLNKRQSKKVNEVVSPITTIETIAPVEPIVEPQTPEFEGEVTDNEPVESISQTPVYNVGGTKNGIYITILEKKFNNGNVYSIKIDNDPDLNAKFKNKKFKTLAEVKKEYTNNGWFTPENVVTNKTYSLQDAEGNSLKSTSEGIVSNKINNLKFVSEAKDTEVTIEEDGDNDNADVQEDFINKANLVVKLGDEKIAVVPFNSSIRRKLQTIQDGDKTRLATTTATINKVIQRDFNRTAPISLAAWKPTFEINNGVHTYQVGYVTTENGNYVLKNADKTVIYTYPEGKQPILGATYLFTFANGKQTQFALQTPKLKDVVLSDRSKITEAEIINLLGEVPTKDFNETGKELYRKVANSLTKEITNSNNSRIKEFGNLVAKELGGENTLGRAASTEEELKKLDKLEAYSEETKDNNNKIIADFFLNRIITLTPESEASHLITTNPETVFLDNSLELNNLVSGNYNEAQEAPRFQVATAQETPQDVVREMVDTLKGTGLANEVFEMTAEEMDAKLQEIGFSEEVRKQIIGERGAEALDRLDQNILLNYTQSAKYIELPFVYRGINSDFSVDYNGVQYFAVNEKYAKAFGKNIIKAKILESKVLDLTKWNKWLKEKGVEDTLFDQDLLNIHESWFDKNKNFTDKNNTSILGLIDVSLNEEDSKYFFDNFEKEFNEADVIYGEDMGNKGEFVYAVKNPNAISVEETPLFQIKEKGVNLTPTGFTYKGDVYLNMSNMRMDTPIHEFSHLLLDWMKVNKPELYQEGLKKVKEEVSKEISFNKDNIKKTKDISQGKQTVIYFNKNTEKAPNLGEIFGQNVEPSGNYITQTESDFLPKGFVQGKVTFKNPLVINVNEDTLITYKNELSKKYGNSKGKNLTNKLKKEGYDGIITINGANLGEIIAFDNAEQEVFEQSIIKDIIDFVKTTQPNLTGEALENEILTELSGRKGVDLLMSGQKSGITDWLKKFWAEVKNMLGLLDASIEQVANMTLEEYANAMAVQLLKGEQFVFDEVYNKASQFDNFEDFVDSMSDFRDAHTAPSKDDTPTENKLEEGGDFSLEEVSKGFSNQPEDYFDSKVGPRYYGYDNKEGRESLTAVNNIIQGTKDGKENQTITAYRAIPKDIDVNDLKDYDWVTLSKSYATLHGESRFGENEYKIIEQEVPITDIWWDGNDINEWGYDTGKTKKYSRRELKSIWETAKKLNLNFQQSNIPQAIERNNGNLLNLAPNGKPSILYQSYKDLGYSDSEAERLTAQVYSDNFIFWFGDWINDAENASKVVDENSQPKLMYHETNADWFIYDKTKIEAGKFDSITPTGIFLKSSDKNIELGDRQMNLFSNIKNPIYAKDRKELENFFSSNIKEYAEIREKITQVKKEAFKITQVEREALNKKRENFTGEIPSEGWSKIENKASENLDKLLDDLAVEFDNLSLEAKPFLDSFMKDSKYDGIFLTSDIGTEGRETDAIIAMEPEQIKSATKNIGTFSTEFPDIRFQMATEEETTQIPDCV